MKTPKILVKHIVFLKKYFTITSIFITTFFAIVSYVAIVYAINSASTGWSVAPSSTADITLIDSSCRRIVNNATSTNNRYIPTTTMSEWNSFALAAPSQGVGIGSCISYTYSWRSTWWWACSASCDGGVQLGSALCERSDGQLVSQTYCGWGMPWVWNTCNTSSCSYCSGNQVWPNTTFCSGSIIVWGWSCTDGDTYNYIYPILPMAICGGGYSYAQMMITISSGTYPNIYTNPWTPVNGVCGSSNGGTFPSVPTANICSAWTTSIVTLSWSTWIWSCYGVSSWANVNCSASQ